MVIPYEHRCGDTHGRALAVALPASSMVAAYQRRNIEVFAIYEALRIFEERRQPGEKYTIFSDFQPAIRRALSDALGPG